MLEARDIAVERQGKMLLCGISCTLARGTMTAIIGPNGAGKSTLLRVAAGVLRPSEGMVEVDGVALALLAPTERTRRIAWLPQMARPAWPVSVEQAVAIGRFAHDSGAAANRAATWRAMDQCGLTALAKQAVTTLSGGELARVHLARALATQAPCLLADEPVAALDPAHALSVMAHLRALADGGSAIAVVLHDVAMAARFADRIMVLKDGAALAQGPTAEVLDSDLLRQTYGVDYLVEQRGGVPLILPISAAAAQAGPTAAA